LTRRQNAELARIRLKFADEEIALKKAQAEMENKQNVIKMDLDLLAAKMADEVATSELAMKDEVESADGSVHSLTHKKRVQDYIEEQREFLHMEAPPCNPQSVNVPQTFAPKRIRDPLVNNPAQPVVDNPSARELFPDYTRSDPQPCRSHVRDVSQSRLSNDFVPISTSVQGEQNNLLPQQHTAGTDQCSEFAKFLLKKDLVFQDFRSLTINPRIIWLGSTVSNQ
jgi:hypothetical protein